MSPRHRGKFVAYYRVSTDRQGASGLGLEAQRKAVLDWLNGGPWKLIAEVTEVESGKYSDRPKLAEALKLCRRHGATLIIAKLDRLSRDAHFLLGLQKAGVKFIAVDMPEANEMMVGIMAVVAQAERKMISERTKAALEAAKARGVKLGNPKGAAAFGNSRDPHKAAAARSAKSRARAHELRDVFSELRAEGITSANGMANALNDRQVATAMGGKWTARTVLNTLARLN